MDQIKRFLKEEEGMEMTEYAVVAALVVAAGVTIWATLGGAIVDKIQELVDAIG